MACADVPRSAEGVRVATRQDWGDTGLKAQCRPKCKIQEMKTAAKRA